MPTPLPLPPESSPLQVLFVIGQLGLGGAEKNLAELVLGLDPRAMAATILVFQPGGEWERVLRDAGVSVVTITPRRGRIVDRVAEIYRLCRRLRPQVLQAFDSVAGIYCAVAGRLARVPVICSCFLATYLHERLQLVQRVFGRFIDHTICNTERGRDYLVAECREPAAKLSVIPNGLDFGRMERGRAGVASLRAELGLAADRPLIGMVGKLNADKNPLLFARAAAIVHRRFPAAAFCLVGSGPDEAQVASFLREQGLAGVFFLVPKRLDAPWLSREFDVAVLSSRTEGLPTVLTEYMYWAKPCVVTDVGDCARVVRDQETGFVVPSDDAERFAGAIATLLADPALATRLGRAGRRAVEDRYSIERYIGDHLALYDRLLRERGYRRALSAPVAL